MQLIDLNKLFTLPMQPSLSVRELRRMHVLLYVLCIGYLSYELLFFFFLIFIKIYPEQIWWSNAIITAIFCFDIFILRKQKNLLVKNIFLLVTYLIIFYHDHVYRDLVSMKLFYIPYMIVTLNIFSMKKERFFLLFYFLLPLVLVYLHMYHPIAWIAHFDITENLSKVSFLTFFAITFISIAIYSYFLVQTNIQYEDSLEDTKENLQTLIDTNAESIWSLDKEFRILSANKVFKEEMFKYFGVKIVDGFRMEEVFSNPSFPNQFKENYYRIFKESSFYEAYDFEDRRYEIHASQLLSKTGEVVGATFYARNITALKKHEDELKQQGINLQTLIDNTYMSIWSVNTDYEIIEANDVYKKDIKRIFGIDVQSGTSMKHIVLAPDYPAQWTEQFKRVFNGERFTEEYEFEDEVYEIMAAPINNLEGKVIGAAFCARDITLKKKSEIELILAKTAAEEASKVKAQFLSNMSHELRTPLNGIIGVTNLLLSEEKLSAQKEHFEILKYTSDHMLSLVNDVLDYNKLDAGKTELQMTVFNLKSVIDQLLVFFQRQAKEKRIQLQIESDASIDRLIKGDLTHLKQVLTNLLSNALKFTTEGYVKLKVETLLNNNRQILQARFAVIDSGIGIDEKHIHKIFESFTQADAKTTRKFGGTGLGLTISAKLIELMGGKLHVESEKNKGSHFWFDLPFEVKENLRIQKDDMAFTELSSFTSMRILVAEDNMVNQLVARRILEKWNLDVTVVDNGKKALEEMAKQKFDMVLMDLEMPIMDGLTAVKEIRKTDRELPIIAFTAASYENMKADLRSKGLNDFVQKPFKPEALHEAIFKLMK